MRTIELSKAKVSKTKLSKFIHLNRQIPPEPHSPMYVWHKYWSRKTWNVVGEFIRHYSNEQEIVFDPFAGSGVVAIEAVRNKRRAIVCDLNPSATKIAELTLRYVDLHSLEQAFERVREKVKDKIEELYLIHCVKCGRPLIATCFIREGDKMTEVRYPMCPSCEHRCEQGKPRKEDVVALEKLEKKKIKEWYPQYRFYYPDGEPFKEKQHYDSIDQLFTRRNLRAAAILYKSIQAEHSPQLRKFLMGAFTSMIHLCTRMCHASEPSPTNHSTAFSSGWTQQSYWAAPRYMEQNVWLKFESAIVGHQGLLKAKEESNREIGRVKITKDWRKVVSGDADVAIITGDSLELMEKMPDESVDYIFTDPPYDASIQYGELSFLWNAWSEKCNGYARQIETHEIIRNDRQKKNFEVYHSLLSNSFKGFYKVLRNERILTLTFHNPTFKVRNATVRGGVFAGFDFQKIHHQPLGQKSAKAQLQPFGSAQGDFYLRFEKPKSKPSREMEEINEERFRRIVIDTTKKVLAERAEPTPYTIIINCIDPVLARMGFFGTLHTGLDVITVLKQSLGNDLQLVKTQEGKSKGELWWFNDPVFVARLNDVPLSERVEEKVFRCLNERGRVTFTQVWDEVSREFPNSLTSDTTSIKQALEIYGRKVARGYWMLKEDVKVNITRHAEIIALLALIGKKRGFDIWIGKREQSDTPQVQGHEKGKEGSLVPVGKLSDFVTTNPKKLDGVKNIKTVLNMDILWIKGQTIVMAFEVEATTTMTSALLRGSNLPESTPKVMVFPEQRIGNFERKMQSPLFRDHFEKESWSCLYFDVLRNEFHKHKESLNLKKLFNLKPVKTSSKSYKLAPKIHQTLLLFDKEKSDD